MTLWCRVWGAGVGAGEGSIQGICIAYHCALGQ